MLHTFCVSLIAATIFDLFSLLNILFCPCVLPPADDGTHFFCSHLLVTVGKIKWTSSSSLNTLQCEYNKEYECDKRIMKTKKAL